MTLNKEEYQEAKEKRERLLEEAEELKKETLKYEKEASLLVPYFIKDILKMNEDDYWVMIKGEWDEKV